MSRHLERQTKTELIQRIEQLEEIERDGVNKINLLERNAESLKTECARQEGLVVRLTEQKSRIGQQFDEVVQEAERSQRAGHTGDTPQKLRGVLEDYRRWTRENIHRLKCFRDDVVVYLRAVGLIVDSIGNAGTHKEKNARIRGLIEHVEDAIQKLHNERADFEYPYCNRFPDLFRSDYSTRYFYDKLDEKDRAIDELKAQLGQEEPATSEAETSEEVPW